ncbi:MAG: hypothetical protein RLZZ519_71 [Bacteroidota bacterium]|jgi:hypothetical protein
MNTVNEKARVLYNYADYVRLCEELLAENKTTGAIQTPDYIEYTRMSVQRMHRIFKTTEILPELKAALDALKGDYHWMVISEAWCGDVGQNLPVIAKAVENHPQIKLEMILRDDNLDFMDQYLTNGGRSIPKLIITDLATNEVVATWGPRPQAAQQMIIDYKALPERKPYSEFIIDMQLWYTKDHTRSLQAELLALVSGLEGANDGIS